MHYRVGLRAHRHQQDWAGWMAGVGMREYSRDERKEKRLFVFQKREGIREEPRTPKSRVCVCCGCGCRVCGCVCGIISLKANPEWAIIPTSVPVYFPLHSHHSKEGELNITEIEEESSYMSDLNPRKNHCDGASQFLCHDILIF